MSGCPRRNVILYATIAANFDFPLKTGFFLRLTAGQICKDCKEDSGGNRRFLSWQLRLSKYCQLQGQGKGFSQVNRIKSKLRNLIGLSTTYRMHSKYKVKCFKQDVLYSIFVLIYRYGLQRIEKCWVDYEVSAIYMRMIGMRMICHTQMKKKMMEIYENL